MDPHGKGAGHLDRAHAHSVRLPAVSRTLAATLALILSACGGGAQSAGAGPTSAPPSASPSATTEPTPDPTPTPERVAVLEPSASFDLGQSLGLVTGDEEHGVVYVQVDSGVLRVDPVTGDFQQVVDGLEPPWGMNIGFGSAWVSTDPVGNGVVQRYDLATGELVANVTVQELPVESLTAFGSIWVPNDHSGSVSRIDPETNEVVATIQVVETPSGGPVHVSAGADRVWAASPKGNLVSGIDPSTNEVVVEITVPEITCGTTISSDRLWIGRCLDGPRKTWVHDPASGDALGELDAVIAANGERAFALTIEPGSRNTLVHAVDPEALTLSAPVAWAGIPNFVSVGTEMVWITSDTQLLGYRLEALPAP